MSDTGEGQKGSLRPDFNRSIMMDFQGARLSSDTGFLLLREMDERFGIVEGMRDDLTDTRSESHSRHTLLQMVR